MPMTTAPDKQAPLLEWAQWYAAHGWPVIPMHTPGPHGCSCREGTNCQHPGKHPRTPKGRNDASTNSQTIAEWWQRWPEANIAIRTDGLFVLDVDVRHNGQNHLRTLEKQYGKLPEGPRVISGSNGDHYYFTLPSDGIGVHSSNGVIAPGVDIKSFQENINAPPSLHASGRRYEWDDLFSLDAFDLTPPPDWLVDLARQARPTRHQSYQAGVTVKETSRYYYLISVAGRSRYNGFSETQIFEALCIANQNCEPPENEATLRKYAQWAARKDMADPYALNPATLDVQASVAPINGTSQATTPTAQISTIQTDVAWGTPFNFDAAMSARDLVKMMRVPPRFLVERLIPDGLTILAAPAKSYKSYFSLSLALATIGEGDWCDTFPVESTGNVVFFGLEAPTMQLRNRMYQLRPQFNPDTCPHDLIFFSGMHCLPPFKNGLQIAIEQVIERYTPRLIVIDPLSYLYRLGRQDDLASATLDLLWPLAEMASKANVAIFAPEHMRKRSKDDVSVVDQLAGSHIKAAIVHGLLMMHREDEEIVIETTMRDAQSQALTLTLDFDSGQHRVIWGYKGANLNIGQSRVDSMRLKTLEALREKRFPMKVMDIIANLGFPNTTQTKDNLRQILHKAERDGDVAQSKRGEYYWIGQN
jgi:hypothetical protein